MAKITSTEADQFRDLLENAEQNNWTRHLLLHSQLLLFGDRGEKSR